MANVHGAAVAIACSLTAIACGFNPHPTSGTVACVPGGGGCCPQGYLCVGRGAIADDGLSNGAGTCFREADLPPEALAGLHDNTPSVWSDPACLVTDWLPPGLTWPDAGISGAGGRIAVGNDGPVDDTFVTHTGGTGEAFGEFPEGSASVATNWAINAVHDNAQPYDIVASPLTKKWVAHFDGEVLFPVVASGRVYVAAKEPLPNVRALDVETGALIWGPIAFGGTLGLACDAVNVYTLDQSGTLSALDAASGSLSWTTWLGGHYLASSAYHFTTPPMAAGGMVYVSGLGIGGSIFGIDAATGDFRWILTTPEGGDGMLAVFDGVAYEAEVCGAISAVDARTCDIRWSVILGACLGGGGTTPVIYEGHMWVRDSDVNRIVDLDGKAVGTFLADLSPSFHGGNAYCVSKGVLTAMDATSQEVKWSFSASPDKTGQPHASAVIAGGRGQVFVDTGDGYVRELKAADGSLVSSDKAGDELPWRSGWTSMAIAHNHLFVPTGKDLVVY